VPKLELILAKLRHRIELTEEEIIYLLDNTPVIGTPHVKATDEEEQDVPGPDTDG